MCSNFIHVLAYDRTFFFLRLNNIPVRRRQWHPTPVLLPGKYHGRRSLVGLSPWGRQESDTTERLYFLFTFLHWRKKRQPTPVFLPGEPQGRGSLVGCRLWGRTESDTTEATQQQQQQQHPSVNVPHFLHPVSCQQTFHLLPPFCYCEHCCSEHDSANIFKTLFPIIWNIDLTLEQSRY